MVLVLCIGDLHVPHRAQDLPPKFKELLKPNKVDHILCCGNLCSKSLLEYLKGICADVKLVQGDFDDFEAPDQLVTQIGDIRVGVCHGHQVVPWGDKEALAILQRQLDVDILVTGHTHAFEVGARGTAVMYGERLQINPGSATGAYSSLNAEVGPSFVLMDVDGAKATVYVYQLVDDAVKVEKIDYQKPGAPVTL
ncbi:Vacuolar protein sorting-associated protein 29 [Monoraphidium neglectum]|uniref:Vacuolar protein sorting-associated protein 29 n=1 Tax=Monoraphidium neglectum TaxID=145388 RepID=A0A0D2NJE8_9CHLO|nr:Vacuolar protein sorting-associated protein 29 [Monoraphidium neglectum]KIZ05006.1 Vacuolar protein sorting-associated protein 29 [Monoraphidium neglectum]|eukprot:XP_013904025.1 Vacuolar protein sorting-associated protein 29 [Monoraphidium neglectum]